MAAADRHLLFGLLALQNGLIDRGQLVAAFRAWTLDKSRGLAGHMEARGDLTGSRRALLEGLAEVHLEAHGGDVEQSLAAISAGRSTREGLAGLGDADLQATLSYVAHAHSLAGEGHHDLTDSYAFGESSGRGQRFRILRPHARGGLGAVFVALDGELNREVALKQILDHHADDPTSRHRFLVEAEITGGLEHPGIVPVYGLGTYAGGRPYYAMRFIRGDSLKEAIGQFHEDRPPGDNPGRRSLSLRGLLRRFTDVCNAIDYAHSRGVLHRDLKPGNVIVGRHGETLVVDWGLAKAMGRSESHADAVERTLIPSSSSGSADTLPGSAIGTPAYMSPEQARGEIDALGPRSDVYSLGATLYCLLTGRPPFEGEDLGVILRRVERGAFARPREVDPSLDRALEAICLKAMATEPEGRYATCRALAEDVDRWMADEPVTSWREPFTTRARRWMRRRKTLVASACAASLAALVGLGAVAAVEARANGQLKSANRQLARSVKRERARFDLAVEAIKTFHTGVTRDELLKEAKFERLRKALLGGARDFYRKLEALLKEQGDPRSRRDLSDAYAELAKLTSEIDSQDQGIALYREAVALDEALARGPEPDLSAVARLARHLASLGVLQASTKEKDEALANYRAALASFEGLSARHPEDRACRSELATVLHNLALLRRETGSPLEALATYERSRTLRRGLVEAEPANAEYQVDLASSDNAIGNVLGDLDRDDEAQAAYERCLGGRKTLVEAHPREAPYQVALAQVHSNLGFHLKLMRRPVDSLAAYERARVILEEVVAADSAVTSYQYELARTYAAMPLVRPRGGRALARSDMERALTLLEQVVAANPRVQRYRVDLTRTLNNLGQVYEQEGRLEEARANYERTRQVRADLVQEAPTLDHFRADLSNSCSNLGEVLDKLGRPEEAIRAFGQALQIRQALAVAYPKHLADQERIAVCQERIAWLSVQVGRPAEGLATYRQALVTRLRLVDPAKAASFYNLACARAQLSRFGGVRGSGLSPEDARAEADRALEDLARAAAAGFRDLEQYRSDTDLDPLRTRGDFRALLLDLAFPADPFAEGR